MSVNSYLLRQAGVISRAQALAAGMSGHAVDRRLERRTWRPLYPRVYLTEGQRLTDEARVRAAVLWAGEGAVLSGMAAAWWYGLVEQAPTTVGVTVPRRRCPCPRPGVTVRRRVLGPVDLVDHRGLAVTAPPLTVLEAALEMGDAGGPFLDRALQRWVSFPLVHSACCRDAGPRGSARAHRLLVAAADRAASAAERRLVGVVRREGLAGWVLNHRVDGVRVGVAFPGAAVAVEVDGWAWHTDANRVAHSDLRREMLVRLGWTVLRYTWAELVGQPEVLLADVARAIGAGGGWPRRP